MISDLNGRIPDDQKVFCIIDVESMIARSNTKYGGLVSLESDLSVAKKALLKAYAYITQMSYSSICSENLKVREAVLSVGIEAFSHF